MNEQPSSTDDLDVEQMVRLLRLAGPRPSAPTERAARVRVAVHQRWQTRNRQRAIRRRALAAALLTAAAGIVVIVGRTSRDRSEATTAPAAIVATVERIDGTPRRETGAGAASAITPNEPVRTGEWIETDGSARVALRFAEGTSVRLDRGSRARPLSRSAIELQAGAVYVDTGQPSGDFEVRTPIAIARDIGTQFEVRLIDAALRLRVRTGLVELRAGGRSVSGRGGTEVSFSATGTATRPIATYGPEWAWTASLAAPLEIEGVALSTFLERIAREHGWRVRYADAALAAEAARIFLRGSVKGLAPGAALDVAITTSGLRHRLENGELTVFRGSDANKKV